MKKSNDRRIRYTRHALQTALIERMQQKPLNRITVREVCEAADINRSTFYMHYKDMYDLMDEIEEQVYQDIDAIFTKETPSVQDMEQLLNYVQKNKDLFHYHSARTLWQKAAAQSYCCPIIRERLSI